MGGMAAQVFAHRHPERVERLILAGTAAYPIDRFRIVTRVTFWLGRALARVSKKEAAMFTYGYLNRRNTIDDSAQRWMWAALLNRDATLYYESGNAVWRFDSRAWIGEISVPTMVIIPQRDDVVPPRGAARPRRTAAGSDGDGTRGSTSRCGHFATRGLHQGHRRLPRELMGGAPWRDR